MRHVTTETQRLLERELERLKKVSRHGQELCVRWIPKESTISGQIRDNVIIIYDFDEAVAMETLYHEFIEYIIIKSIDPYREFANKMMEMFNENAYVAKEKSVDGITNLLSWKQYEK